MSFVLAHVVPWHILLCLLG